MLLPEYNYYPVFINKVCPSFRVPIFFDMFYYYVLLVITLIDCPVRLCPVLAILRTAVLCRFTVVFCWVQGGDEYTSWRRYRALYSTPEADRDYLQYWDTIVKKIKVCLVQLSASSSSELCIVFLFSWTNNVCSWQWLERYVLINDSSLEVCICDLSTPTMKSQKTLNERSTTTLTFLSYYLVGAKTSKGYVPSI
jgi:hypothetical protein